MSELDSLLRRILEGENKSGRDGSLLEGRYGIQKRDGKWDCNDRAEWAEKYLKDRGYEVKRFVESTDDPNWNHVFLRVSKDGKTEDVLRYKRKVI